MSFNFWTFLFEVFNFLVLAFVLHRLLYRPLREAVERRQHEAIRIREDAERMSRDAEATQHQFQQQRAAQEQERQKLMQKAHEQAEADRKNLLADAERVIRERQTEARQTVEREREEALRTMRGEALALALDLTRRLLVEAVDRSLHNQLALRLAQTLRAIPEAEREHLRADWQPEDGAVLESAEELDGSALHEVIEAAGTALGRAVTPEVRLRPELIAGCRLRLGSQVWDATLTGPLNEVVPATV